ncbi:MAG: 30S ribosome-binding factor RbfA [Sedimentisphaeraceae bacterium JB056]
MELTRRQQRMARNLRDIVSEAIMNDISDPRMTGLVSITDIELSPDLRYASIYIRCFGTENEAAKKKSFLAIEHARGHIQSKLAAELNVRFCPVISFHEDLKQEKVNEMLKLIEEVSKEFKDDEPQKDPD